MNGQPAGKQSWGSPSSPSTRHQAEFTASPFTLTCPTVGAKWGTVGLLAGLMSWLRMRLGYLRLGSFLAILLASSLVNATIASDELAWLHPYNVVWTSPSRDSSESMPCGGGDIGMNVWVENGEILSYLQRSGSLDENNEYLKLGRLRVRISPNPFTADATFRQELKLREGYVEIRAGKEGANSDSTVIRVWAEVHRSVVHVEVESIQPVTVTAAYENWRQADEVLPDDAGRARFGAFSWDRYPGKVIRYRDEVGYEDNRVVFHHRNRDDRLLFDYAVRQQGLERVRDQLFNPQVGRTFGGAFLGEGFVADGTSEGQYLLTPFKAWRLRSAKASTQHRLRVVTHIAQTESLAAWRAGLAELVAAREPSIEVARKSTQDWWADFWRRSHIVIAPERPDEGHLPWQIARNYQVFRYQLACNVRGEFPTKFNGGNFTFDPSLVDAKRAYGPDWRAWGGGSFTAQNQRLVHWPMLKAGDADLVVPQMEFYRRALPSARARVREYWGHDGALFTEHSETFGLPIAAGWGWSEPEATGRQRGQVIPFGDPRADGAQGYNSVVEHGVQANPSVSYHWESQLEFAYLMLEHHRFFGRDLKPYLQFIDQAIRFFDEHYQVRERLRSGRPVDTAGRLVIFPSTACESYRGARNPADLIAGLSACLDALLALDDHLVPTATKEYYRSFLGRVPAYTYGEVNGDRVLQPAESWKRYQNFEAPQFYPLFPFNRFSLGQDDMTVFRQTWQHGNFPKDRVQSWHQNGIFFARMGLTQEAANFNTRKLQNSQRRFPTFWGPGYDWTPDHNWGGSGMIGLQEMLMQTPGRKILLLPAWPKEWNCSFRLHAPHETIVEATVADGQIVALKVTPESRRADVVLPPYSAAIDPNR